MCGLLEGGISDWHTICKMLSVSSQSKRIRSLPPFLQSNPDAMNALKKFGIANLNDLSVEKMYEYVHEHLLPTLVASLGVDVPDDCDVYEDLSARPGQNIQNARLIITVYYQNMRSFGPFHEQCLDILCHRR